MAAHQAILHYLLELVKFTSIESMMTSNHLIFCHPLLLSIFPSIKVVSNETTLHIRWLVYWSFRFSISLSDEYSWLISFTIDWFYLFTVHWTLKIFSNTTVQKYQFFSAQLFLWSNCHIHTWLLKNHSFDYTDLCWQSNVSAF